MQIQTYFCTLQILQTSNHSLFIQQIHDSFLVQVMAALIYWVPLMIGITSAQLKSAPISCTNITVAGNITLCIEYWQNPSNFSKSLVNVNVFGPLYKWHGFTWEGNALSGTRSLLVETQRESAAFTEYLPSQPNNSLNSTDIAVYYRYRPFCQLSGTRAAFDENNNDFFGPPAGTNCSNHRVCYHKTVTIFSGSVALYKDNQSSIFSAIKSLPICCMNPNSTIQPTLIPTPDPSDAELCWTDYCSGYTTQCPNRNNCQVACYFNGVPIQCWRWILSLRLSHPVAAAVYLYIHRRRHGYYCCKSDHRCKRKNCCECRSCKRCRACGKRKCRCSCNNIAYSDTHKTGIEFESKHGRSTEYAYDADDTNIPRAKRVFSSSMTSFGMNDNDNLNMNKTIDENLPASSPQMKYESVATTEDIQVLEEGINGNKVELVQIEEANIVKGEFIE